MSEPGNHFYEFGPFKLDRGERILVRNGEPVSLTPKAFDTLLLLVRNSGHVVTKDDLMREVWPETYVEEGNLAQNIFILRKVLGDSRYIETVPRRGYRFSAGVRDVCIDEIEHAPAAAKQSTRVRVPQGIPHEQAHDSIAVLPFANVSNNANTEYLSDGITESIINMLSQLPQLHVMARSAVFRHKGQEINPQEIGRQLGVRAVLVGRARSLEDRLIINTELVDVANGWQLWGEQYNREFHDVFEVQEEIARRISESLRIKLSGKDEERLLRRYTENFEAYRAYLRGRYYWGKYTKESLYKAIRCFQQATDLDPGYALAYTGIADSYFRLASSYLPPLEALAKAKAAAMMALEIDELLAEAHASLGIIKMRYDWDWEGAESEFKRAIELKPNYATAHLWYSVYLDSQGRFTEAMSEVKLALKQEPLSLQINITLGSLFWKMRDYDKAIEQLNRTLDMSPEYQPVHFVLGLIHEQRGEFAEAIAELEKANQLGNTAMIRGFLGHTYALSGDQTKALEVLEELGKEYKFRYISPYSVALIYVPLGQHDLAFEWLEKAYRQRDEFLALLGIDPRLDGLRGDRRFDDLMKRVGLSTCAASAPLSIISSKEPDNQM